jgi:hypothetical protein
MGPDELIQAEAKAIPKDGNKCPQDSPQAGTRVKSMYLLSSGRALEE